MSREALVVLHIDRRWGGGHRGHPQWRRLALRCRGLALASIPFFLPFIVP